MDNNLNIKTGHVCRTCMEEIINTPFFHLDFIQIDSEPTIGQKLSNCIPELDLSIVPNTVICGKCVDTINSLYIFKEECLRLEMQIREYIQQVQHTGSAIDLAAVIQFQQLHSKSLTTELKREAFEKTDYCKIEEPTTSFCGNYAFNETERYTEIANKEYITSLQMVERQCVLFNTFENVFNSDQSEAEKNFDTPDNSNVVQDCLLQIVENSGSCIQNLNKTDIYYQCFTCGYKAESKLKLKSHMLTHAGKKPFKCSICEYSCKHKYYLKRHMLSHVGERPFKCSICEYSCNRKDSLKNHMLTHAGEKPFKCSICEYSCKHKLHLKRHMLTHAGEKPVKCSVCEYRCNRKDSLKSHMLTHTGGKPLKCLVCEYSCNHRQSLKSHMLTHAGEKPFKCLICEYSCNQKQNLKSHMLIHTGEKPFKCSICEYRCRHKPHLKRHMLTHMSEKPF